MDKKQVKTIVIAAVILVVAIFGGVYLYTQKQAQLKSLSSEKTALFEQMQAKDSLMNDLENTFSEIENNLTFIKEKRSKLSIEEGEGVKDQKKELLADITLMNTMLEESSKKIDELETKLKKSGINMRAFEKRIAALNSDISTQNNQIAELQQMIEQKDFQIAELETKITEQNEFLANQTDSLARESQRLAERTNELNTGHVAYGTFQELKEKGLLTKEGGFLGLGSNKVVNNQFDEDYFTTLDIRDTKVIPLHAKKAQVISEHPTDSYSLVEEEGQIAYLQIDNPDEFWKISKYAVIEVK
jgi:predicted  nucleic acid-binding Zn-ribbon protein